MFCFYVVKRLHLCAVVLVAVVEKIYSVFEN